MKRNVLSVLAVLALVAWINLSPSLSLSAAIVPIELIFAPGSPVQENPGSVAFNQFAYWQTDPVYGDDGGFFVFDPPSSLTTNMLDFIITFDHTFWKTYSDLEWVGTLMLTYYDTVTCETSWAYADFFAGNEALVSYQLWIFECENFLLLQSEMSDGTIYYDPPLPPQPPWWP
ncbi:MAG TPA: hypothetical protein VJI33_03050 [Candidatus Paceibacterota bacterium]